MLTSNHFSKVAPLDYPLGSPYSMLQYSGGRNIDTVTQHNGVGASSDNLFSFDGSIHVLEITGTVTDVTNVAAVTLARLEAIAGGAAVPITLAAGVALTGMAVNSIVDRHGPVATALHFHDAVALAVEDETVNTLLSPFRVYYENGSTNYIRFAYTGGAGTDFTIHWQMRWRPLGEDGVRANVVAV